MSALALDYPPPFVEPAHLWVPPGRRGTYGPEVVDFTADIGHPVDAEQAADIDALASFGPGGMWHAFETCVIEARQNGKTDRTLLPITLYEFFILTDVFGPDVITWTAHLMDTCRAVFDTIQRLIDANPDLSRRVKEITDAKSEEAIELTNGAVMEFRARTGKGGRGRGGTTWVGDEALILPSSVMAARLPTLSARPNPQVRYGSSAGLVDSEHLASLVARGRAGNDPSLIYIERCAPGSWEEPGCASPSCTHVVGVTGCTLDREDLYHHANHAAGRRIGYQFLRNERRTLTPLDFGRERLGWHESVKAAGGEPIPLTALARCVDPASKPSPASRLVFSLDVELDRGAGAIGMAGRRSDGLAHAAVIDYRPGTAWMIPRAFELADRHKARTPIFVVNDVGPAGSLLSDSKVHGRVLRMTGDDGKVRELPVQAMTKSAMAKATGALYDDTTEATGPTWRYPGPDPATGLDHLREALRNAKTRPIGDAWALDRRLDSDICPAVAVIAARHGLSSLPLVSSMWGFFDV